MSSLGLELNTERFNTLMTRLIGVTEQLQNNPSAGLIPKESMAASIVLEFVIPHSVQKGGTLTYEFIAYDEKKERANLIIGYQPPGWVENNGTITFLGCHLDVVPANPADWSRNPFELTIEGDNYYGRGTTDCLGHVAMVTDIMIQLDEKKPALKQAIWAVFIASEENETPGIGIDQLYADGLLDRMKNGPVYWLDSSDVNPCMACGSVVEWKLQANGVAGHSGMPDQAINSIELGDEAVKYLQDEFYKKYPKNAQEVTYNFKTPSTMKPTKISCSEGAVNQIPATTEILGDVRLTPFYSINECIVFLKELTEQLNQDITVLPTRGPVSQYVIPNPQGGEDLKGTLYITFGEPLLGIACDIESNSFIYLCEATNEEFGECVPYSVTGSLPLVGEMKENGYDIQITGYGLDAVYHAPNEYCTLSYMQYGVKIMSRVIDKYNA